MEKNVLLVLLCLSFLLVTVAVALVEDNQQHRQRRLCPYLRPCLVTKVKPKFGLSRTATDAAALVEENQKQLPSLCIYLGPCPATTGLGCFGRPGGCNIFGKEHQDNVQLELSKRHKIKETKSILP